MAKFVTRIATPRTPDEAFDYMADLRNFEQWDPGVRAVRQIVGEAAGIDHEFDVDVEVPTGVLTLRYVTDEFDRPHSATVVASSSVFTSRDVITVEPDGDGSVVTYDAELTLNGPLGLFDLVLRPVFGRIGGRANRGLIAALDGTQR